MGEIHRRNGFSQENTVNKVNSSVALLLATLLMGCGGGGGGAGDVPPQQLLSTTDSTDLTLIAGNDIVVEGSIHTDRYLLKSIGWQVIPATASSPDLILKNQTCAAVTKEDKADSILPNAGLGQSTWSCSLGVISTQNVQQETTYKLLLSGTDNAGQTTTVTKTLMVKPNPTFVAVSSGLVVSIAGSLTGKPGQTLTLKAASQWTGATDAKTPVNYSWSVDAGSERVAKLLLSNGAEVQLYLLPGQTASAFIPVTVTASGAGSTASATALARLDVQTLNIETAGSLIGKPGQILNLGALAKWTDTTSANDTPIIYSWSLDPAGTQFAKLLSNTGNNVQLYLSPLTASSMTPVTVPITVTASGNGATALASMVAVIDPFTLLGPSVCPAVQDVRPGQEVTVMARDIDVGDPSLFYLWSVLGRNDAPFGPLAGSNTLNLGFWAPPLLTATEEVIMKVKFAVGHYPITASYPGVYSVDALVRVTNNPPLTRYPDPCAIPAKEQQ